MSIPLPPTPRTAVAFQALMAQIWADECKPAEDGKGLIARLTSPLYDEWHNARKVAAALGARAVAPTTRAGEPGYIYRFANGDRIYINRQGSLVDEAKAAYRRVA